MNNGLHESIEAIEAILEDVPEGIKRQVVRAIYHKHGDIIEDIPEFAKEYACEMREAVLSKLQKENEELREHLVKGTNLWHKVLETVKNHTKGTHNES